MSDLYLIHHGIKGQKWGIRRFQNEDGTRTEAGKRRESENYQSSEKKKFPTKKVILGASIVGLTIGAAVAYKNSPFVREAVNSAAQLTYMNSQKQVQAGKKFVEKAAKSTINEAKQVPRKAAKGLVKGMKEGVEQAPEKVGKAVVTGAVLLTAKRMLDNAVGKEESERIFKANNPKKIDSFWKVQQQDKED